MAATHEMQRKTVEEFDVRRFIREIEESEGKGLPDIMKKFMKDYGGHKEFIGYVGSATVALAERYKYSPPGPDDIGVIRDKLLGKPRENVFSKALDEMTKTLGESNNALRVNIESKGGTVQKESLGMSAADFFEQNLTIKNPLKVSDAMLKIRGLDNPDQIREIVSSLLKKYDRAAPRGSKEVEFGERIRTVNAVLAGEYQDLTYSFNCAKNRAEFKDLKAA